MLALCKHADLIAAFDDVMQDGEGHLTLEIMNRGRIDTYWFKQHLGHQLIPIDEYGVLLGQCRKRIECEAGYNHDCQLDRDHEEPCSSKRRQR